jgi:small-conductance mechanosensitive channel
MDTIISFIQENDLTLKIIFIVLSTFLIAFIFRRAYKKFLERSERTEDEHLTTYKFLEKLITITIYLAGLSYAISQVPFLKPVAQSVLAGAGIFAIAVGFAAQQALGNIISGVFIVLSKPYQINDRITLDEAANLRGIVEDISLRHTVIRNFENQRIIIPNSIISNQVLVNSSFEDPKVCRFVDIGISYGSDLDLAKQIMADEVEKHPLNIDIRTPEDIESGIPRVTVRVISMLDSSITLRAWAWADDAANGFVLTCDVMESIKKRFDKEGIVIPFPQRTISYLEPPSKPDEKTI